jgi:xylulokinase
MGATRPGTAVVSLGTSDTVFASMSHPRTDPRGFGHVFGNPAGGFMCLICFANGSLAREKVKDKVGLDWTGFEKSIVQETKPGNEGALLLPYFVSEMTPKLLNPTPRLFGDEAFREYREPARAARAIVEAQALAMQRYSQFIGEKPTRILATGGASRNAGILQVIADVFQAEVRTLEVGNSSALGGALRAANALGGETFETLFERFAAPEPKLSFRPNPSADYASLRARFEAEVDRLASA